MVILGFAVTVALFRSPALPLGTVWGCNGKVLTTVTVKTRNSICGMHMALLGPHTLYVLF